MELMKVRVDREMVCQQFLFKEGKSDVLGWCLRAQGVPTFVLDGYVSPSDCLMGILIYQEVEEAKDTHVGLLNRLIKPDSTFTDRPGVIELAMACDSMVEAGAVGDPIIETAVRELAGRLGYDIEFFDNTDVLENFDTGLTLGEERCQSSTKAQAA